MTQKLDIKRELEAVDLRDYDFFDNLNDDEKKEFSPYILMRYTSTAQGDRDIQEWFIERTNEMVNKNHWSLSKNHKSLLWKLFAGVGIGEKVYHQYLAVGKKQKVNKIEKLLAEIYPSWKIDDIKTLANLMTKQDIEDLLDNMGLDKKQRKNYE